MLPISDIIVTDKLSIIRDRINSILTAFTDLSFDEYGNYEIAKNLSLTGSLTQSGTSVLLNSGETGSGVTSGTAGLSIDRGLLDNAMLLYDESDDKWKVGESGGSFTALSLEGHTHDDRYYTETEVDTLFTGYLKKDGTVALTGNLRLGGNWISNDGGSEGLSIDNNGHAIFSGNVQAQTLSLVNGLTTTELYTYNTFSSSTNYERLGLTYSSNVAVIDSQKGSGGGTARPLSLAIGGVKHLNLTTLGVTNFVAEDADFDTDEVLSTGITSGYGLLVVRESVGGVCGVFRIENQTIVVASVNAAFTITKDNAATYNVYWETDQFKIQNKVGDNKSIKVGFYGI